MADYMDILASGNIPMKSIGGNIATPSPMVDWGTSPMLQGYLGSGYLNQPLPGIPQMNVDLTAAGAGAGGSDWLSGFLGNKAGPGWGSLALQGISGIGNLFMGMKQYGLAKQSLAEDKRRFELNYANQAKLTNASLEDRQRARLAANPNHESVSSYMSRYGV